MFPPECMEIGINFTRERGIVKYPVRLYRWEKERPREENDLATK